MSNNKSSGGRLVRFSLIAALVLVIITGAAAFYINQSDKAAAGDAVALQENSTEAGAATPTDNIPKEETLEINTPTDCTDYSTIDSGETFVAEGFEPLQTVMEKNVEAHSFQGTVLVGVGNEVVYAQSFGYANAWNGVPNNTQTRYGIASLTKSFTAAAIMQLEEQGYLSLDDNLTEYFPQYAYADDITVRELLQMRSGIVDYLNDMDKFMVLPDSKAVYDSYIENEDYAGLDKHEWPREEMLDNMCHILLDFTPDERYSYSNTNYYLLGCIIEEETGMSYADYINRYILSPCGMDKSSLAPEDGDAVGYIRDEGFISSNYSTLFSTGAIRSTVFDMFSWLRNLKNGQIVKSDSFAEMTDISEVAEKNAAYEAARQEKLKEEQGDEYEEPVIDPEYVPTNYGLGLMVTGNEVWHRGYIDGFASYMSVNMENDVTIIILTNTSEELATTKLDTLWKTISECAGELVK